MSEAQPAERMHSGKAAEPSHTTGAGAEGPAEVLKARVVRPLLAAMRDYTTNDRGDVGSWVRARL